jgi:hypothetical protein
MSMSRLTALTLVTLLAVPAFAQAPEGWMVRIDRSTSASDPDDTPNLKVVTVGKGFQVTGGPAGTFWNPKNTAAGSYTARATFTLQKPSGHVNYYGLVFGGADIGASAQSYVYFVIAQNGTFLIRQRTGDQVTDVHTRTPHAAIVQPGADGKSVNALEVRVAGNTVSYVVNGQVVHSAPKGTLKTDGLVGVRINHQLDVLVDGFSVQTS